MKIENKKEIDSILRKVELLDSFISVSGNRDSKMLAGFKDNYGGSHKDLLDIIGSEKFNSLFPDMRDRFIMAAHKIKEEFIIQLDKL